MDDDNLLGHFTSSPHRNIASVSSQVSNSSQLEVVVRNGLMRWNEVSSIIATLFEIFH